MDEKDLKIQALTEEIGRLAGDKADLRVQVTVLMNQRDQQNQQQDPPMVPLEGTIVDD